MPIALVTGASRGLGRALAAALADRGWSLVLTARTTADLDRTVSEIGSGASGARAGAVVGVAGDVSDAVHRRDVVDAVRTTSDGAGLDLLVANASTLGPLPMRGLREVTGDDLAAVLAVNVLAPHELVRALLPDLEQATGAVLTLSSDAAVGHYGTWGAYGASKAALDHLTLTLGEEVPGVRAWALDPGDMRTGMHQDAFPGEDISDRPLPEQVAVPAVLALLDTRPPSGRLVAADVVAAAGTPDAGRVVAR
ncbi:SDR family NAD(P)-dependent oxidoreductase [Intrasporangium sp. YIM S08009]|uniref:SDR family NAD(P)-dependent oxidoreductase n=1 Tax=Intrasporangium zincisolvens TaxID=3080018 RepID=UPI002B053EC1|nr:SDR family NAD(P)-dependent oxidoreductase [Intrasporangium sp. YIM S08009]